MALLSKILNRFSSFGSAVISEEEIGKDRKELEALTSLGILKQVSSPKERLCPTCSAEFLPLQVVSANKAFTLCTAREDAGRDYFDPQGLKQWRMDTPRLLSLFQEAIGIKSPEVKENIANTLWSFETKAINGVKYHSFFSRNIDAIGQPNHSILTALPHSVLFYIGTPHTSLPDNVLLVPISDLIDSIGTKGLKTDKEILEQYFPVGVYATSEGVVDLDDNMVLQSKAILHERLRGGVFKKSIRIRPMAQRLIEYFHQIRNYPEPAKTLDELASSFSSTKVSISNEINRIATACTSNNLPQILHKFDDEKWGLNPQLKCCRTVH